MIEVIDIHTGVDTGRATYRHSTDTSLLPGGREELTACAFHYISNIEQKLQKK